MLFRNTREVLRKNSPSIIWVRMIFSANRSEEYSVQLFYRSENVFLIIVELIADSMIGWMIRTTMQSSYFVCLQLIDLCSLRLERMIPIENSSYQQNFVQIFPIILRCTFEVNDMLDNRRNNRSFLPKFDSFALKSYVS